MQKTERLVVIGGDAAGMSAASQARRMRGDLEIVAFERGGYTSYSACGMPYYVGGVVTDVEPLIARTPSEFQARRIEAHVRHEVESIDLHNRRFTSRAWRTAAFSRKGSTTWWSPPARSGQAGACSALSW